MKRLLTIVLALVMILPATSLADVPDLSGLSAEELLETIRAAQLLLFSSELVNGITVPQGEYIIGEDIPAGTYRIEITGTGGYYDLYKSKGGQMLATGLTGSTYHVSDIGKLVLEDGNVLMYRNSTFIFYPYTGVFH